jgi:hypothetical protein
MHHKGKRITTVIVQGHGLDSGDEYKVISMDLKGDVSVANCSFSSTSNIVMIHDERKKTELFHIRVTSRYAKIDTFINSGS